MVDYNLLEPMGPKNPGGGVALKYARVQEACSPYFKAARIGSVDEIEPNDIVFADWMWFCVIKDDEGDITNIDKVKAFIEIPNIKLVYGSEFCVSGLPFTLIQKITDAADMVLHNSKHLRNLYRVIAIYNSFFLSDPVPPIFSPSIDKKRRVVCMGQISEAKNTGAVVSLFEALEGTGIERAFLGGRSLWGEESLSSKQKSVALQDQIEELSDIFIENATQMDVAKVCSESMFYAHYAIHDVSSYAGQENTCAGNITFGLGHPILKERFGYVFETPLQIAEAIKNYSVDTDQYETDFRKTLEIAGQWSYESWRDQMSTVLRRIL